MDKVVTWAELCPVIEHVYPKARARAFVLRRSLRLPRASLRHHVARTGC